LTSIAGQFGITRSPFPCAFASHFAFFVIPSSFSSAQRTEHADSSDYDYEQEHQDKIANTSTHHDALICSLIHEGNAL
jgi:hypothetical protein